MKNKFLPVFLACCLIFSCGRENENHLPLPHAPATAKAAKTPAPQYENNFHSQFTTGAPIAAALFAIAVLVLYYCYRPKKTKNLQDENNELTRQIETTQTEKLQLIETVDKMRKEIPTLQAKKTELTSQTETTQTENSKLKETLAKTRQEIKNLQADKTELTNQTETAQTKKLQLIETVDKMRKEIPTLQAKKTELTSQTETAQTKKSQLTETVDKMRKEIPTLQAKKTELTSQTETTQTENSKLKETLAKIRQEIKNLQADKTELTNQTETAQTKKLQLIETVNKMQQETLTLQAKNDELTRQKEAAQTENSKLKKELTDTQQSNELLLQEQNKKARTALTNLKAQHNTALRTLISALKSITNDINYTINLLKKLLDMIHGIRTELHEKFPSLKKLQNEIDEIDKILQKTDATAQSVKYEITNLNFDMNWMIPQKKQNQEEKAIWEKKNKWLKELADKKNRAVIIRKRNKTIEMLIERLNEEDSIRSLKDQLAELERNCVRTEAESRDTEDWINTISRKKKDLETEKQNREKELLILVSSNSSLSVESLRQQLKENKKQTREEGEYICEGLNEWLRDNLTNPDSLISLLSYGIEQLQQIQLKIEQLQQLRVSPEEEDKEEKEGKEEKENKKCQSLAHFLAMEITHFKESISILKNLILSARTRTESTSASDAVRLNRELRQDLTIKKNHTIIRFICEELNSLTKKTELTDFMSIFARRLSKKNEQLKESDFVIKVLDPNLYIQVQKLADNLNSFDGSLAKKAAILELNNQLQQKLNEAIKSINAIIRKSNFLTAHINTKIECAGIKLICEELDNYFKKTNLVLFSNDNDMDTKKKYETFYKILEELIYKLIFKYKELAKVPSSLHICLTQINLFSENAEKKYETLKNLICKLISLNEPCLTYFQKVPMPVTIRLPRPYVNMYKKLIKFSLILIQEAPIIYKLKTLLMQTEQTEADAEKKYEILKNSIHELIPKKHNEEEEDKENESKISLILGELEAHLIEIRLSETSAERKYETLINFITRILMNQEQS